MAKRVDQKIAKGQNGDYLDRKNGKLMLITTVKRSNQTYQQDGTYHGTLPYQYKRGLLLCTNAGGHIHVQLYWE